jgi:hypothetical protein
MNKRFYEMKNKFIFGIAVIIIGLLIALGPQTLFPVCEAEEMIMKCFWTARAELGAGLVIALLGLATLLFPSIQTRRGFFIAIGLNALLALFIPSILIGVCAGKHMRCHALTLPALLVLSAVLLALAIVNSLLLEKTKE